MTVLPRCLCLVTPEEQSNKQQGHFAKTGSVRHTACAAAGLPRAVLHPAVPLRRDALQKRALPQMDTDALSRVIPEKSDPDQLSIQAAASRPPGATCERGKLMYEYTPGAAWEGPGGERPKSASAPQEVTDTVGLRRRIGESFELAALPGTTEEDRRKALHFCVVGGGPTGDPHTLHACCTGYTVRPDRRGGERCLEMCTQAFCLSLLALAARAVADCWCCAQALIQHGCWVRLEVAYGLGLYMTGGRGPVSGSCRRGVCWDSERLCEGGSVQEIPGADGRCQGISATIVCSLLGSPASVPGCMTAYCGLVAVSNLKRCLAVPGLNEWHCPYAGDTAAERADHSDHLHGQPAESRPGNLPKDGCGCQAGCTGHRSYSKQGSAPHLCRSNWQDDILSFPCQPFVHSVAVTHIQAWRMSFCKTTTLANYQALT